MESCMLIVEFQKCKPFINNGKDNHCHCMGTDSGMTAQCHHKYIFTAKICFQKKRNVAIFPSCICGKEKFCKCYEHWLIMDISKR